MCVDTQRKVKDKPIYVKHESNFGADLSQPSFVHKCIHSGNIECLQIRQGPYLHGA